MHSLFERWERRAFEFGWLLLVKIILHHDQFALDFYSILVSDAVDGLIMLFPRINKAVKKTLSLRRWTGSKEFEALRAWKSPVWSWKFWKVSESRRIDGHGCFLWRSKKIMYICGKCFFTTYMRTIYPISMQKTVRAQIGPVKKKLPHNEKKQR